MRRWLSPVVLCLWLAGLAPACAQVQEEALKAAVIYNFVQFTQWPDKSNAPLYLCASADNPLYEALQRAVAQPRQGREVIVVPIANAGPGDCHVVFMSNDDKRRAAQFQRLLAGPVLGVTDDPSSLPSEMTIVMSLERNRIVFSVNNARALASGLSISSRLLRLARSVR